MRSRWWAIVLGVSVALNLFFLGWVSARALQRAEIHAEHVSHGRAGAGPRRTWQGPRPLSWMSESERAELRPRRKGLRSARRDAEDAMRAEPFDPERLGQALGALRTETGAIQASVHEYMLRRATVMSADERRRLADAQWGPERPERGPERTFK
jgi:uncharacterized membrane protein